MNLKKLRLAAPGLILAVLLTACNMPINPTPRPSPTATPTAVPTQEVSSAIGSACVVGSWQISDLASYMQAMAPQIVEGATITLGEVSGTLRFTFNADGTTLGQAEQFKVNAKVASNNLSLPGVILINGTSQGNYQADDAQGILTLTNMNPGDLKLSATVAGLTVMGETPLSNFMSFGTDESGNGSVNYQCIGDSLQITMEFPKLGQRVVTLQRITP